MGFTDLDFFNKIRKLNEKYLKLADANYKIYEEYCLKNAEQVIKYLKNSFSILIEIIKLNNMPSEAKKIDSYLEKYILSIQRTLILTYFNLIDIRKKDLIINLPEKYKLEIQELISSKRENIINKMSILKEQGTMIVLDAIIDNVKQLYEFIEKLYKDHHLMQRDK